MRIVVLAVGMGMCILVACHAQVEATDTNTSAPLLQKEERMNVTQTDLKALIQATIDLEALQGYYHVDNAPDRKPLVILKNDVIQGDLGLSKFGMPVHFCAQDEVRKKPYLEVTKATVSGTSAVVEFQYPVEGIRGTVHFKKTGDAWGVESHEIVEK